MINLIRNSLLVLLCIVSLPTLEAQTIVSGIITENETHKPLPGANIAVKGSVIGTISDADGKYSLKIKQATPYTLVFSFLGFGTEEIVVTESNAVINISMKEESLLGTEVVVSASRMEGRAFMRLITSMARPE